MINHNDLIGRKFGRWTILEFAYKKGKYSYYKCICDCGTEKNVLLNSLKYNKSKSCGCYNKETMSKTMTTHGMRKTRFYNIWNHMKHRCYNKNVKDYKYYGERGIKVCAHWLESFENFRDDMYESYLEHVKQFGEKNTTIDRFPDQNGNYELTNVRWATYKEQSNNQRSNHFLTFNGQTMTMTQWAKKINSSLDILNGRINRQGWSTKKALTTPIRKKLHNSTRSPNVQ